MSETAKSARAAMKSKANRMTSESSGSVDASGWSSKGTFTAEKKTGAQPARSAFKSGGKVMGPPAKHNAGSKPRTKKMGGGALTDPRADAAAKIQAASALANVPTKVLNPVGRGSNSGSSSTMPYKSGGEAKHPEGKKLVSFYATGGAAKKRRASGGKVQDYDFSRTGSGTVTKDAPAKSVPTPSPRPTDFESDDGDYDNGKTGAGAVTRDARKSGGRTKAKTNVNITIVQPSGPSAGQPDASALPPGLGPMKPPGMGMPSPAGVPVPMPMPAAPPPAGMPGGMPGGMGAGPSMMPPSMHGGPMPRKRGGRTMRDGSGSGEGRLEKMEIAKSCD